MATKDARGNNIRRGDRVRLLDDREEGTADSTLGHSVIVTWDERGVENCDARKLVLCNTTMGRRGS